MLVITWYTSRKIELLNATRVYECEEGIRCIESPLYNSQCAAGCTLCPARLVCSHGDSASIINFMLVFADRSKWSRTDLLSLRALSG